MSISDRLSCDPEYSATFLRLVRQEAEDTRLDAEELLEHRFTLVQVVGQDAILWLRGGRYFTTEAALSEVRPTIEEKE